MSASGLRRDSDAAAPPSGLVRTDEVFAGLEPARLGALERAHGNGDLVRVLEALGIAGPFVAVTPWELEGPAGERLINAGGYAALPFGEAYPPLVAFVARYLEANRWMGLPQQALSPWRGALEANLVALLAREAPSHADSQVFFSNSGAEAVETALKLVRAARPGARYLINFARAYHGKTLGALSLTPNEEFQAPFRPLLEGVVTLPYGDAQRLEDAVRKLGPDNVAGVIVEPVQGEGGVITPPAEFLPALERLRQRYGLVVVADEIQTGLGRCGALFKALAMGLEPDVITLAKPLGGGLVPVGATLARRAIMARALGGSPANGTRTPSAAAPSPWRSRSSPSRSSSTRTYRTARASSANAVWRASRRCRRATRGCCGRCGAPGCSSHCSCSPSSRRAPASLRSSCRSSAARSPCARCIGAVFTPATRSIRAARCA